MWVLEFLGESLVHLLVLLSAIGLLILPLLYTIPFFVTYKTAAQYILIAVFAIGIFSEGMMTSNDSWESRLAEQRIKDAKKETKAAEKTIEVVEKVVEKVKIVKEKQDALIIKVPVYITEKVDAECPIPNSVIQLFDYSATNTVPGSSEHVQEGSSDVTMSEMQTTTINNNKQYYILKEEYEHLLKWVEEQKELYNGR